MWSYNHSPPLNEFYHHGVKGMKWGVRNEEPSSPRKTSTDNTRYGSGKSKAMHAFLYALDILSPIPIGLLVSAGSGLNTRIQAEKEAKRGLSEEEDMVLTKKAKECTQAEDEKAVNPGFTGFGGGTSNNCANCTMAYDLRKRGYDVTAKPLYGGRSNEDIGALFGNPKVNSVSVSRSDPDYPKGFLNSFNGEGGNFARGKLFSELGKYPDGARGAVTLRFNNAGGHIFNWEVSGGKPRLVDTQNYGSKPDRYFQDVDPESITYFRTDNAKINMKLVHETVKNRN